MFQSATNYGVDGEGFGAEGDADEPDELDDQGGPMTQMGVVFSALGGDFPLVFGEEAYARFGVVFGAGRMTCHPSELAAAVEVCRTEGGFDPDKWGPEALASIAPLWLLRQLPNMPASHVSIDHNACGPNNTITCRDASAILALSEAVRVIEAGRADAMIVGACSSNIHPVDIAKFHRFEGLSRRNDDPSRACRPCRASAPRRRAST